ncbi:MAG: hypothetical protein Q9226_008612 [Calogaya cf. arnoldii]
MAPHKCDECGGPNHGDPDVEPCNAAVFAMGLQDARAHYKISRPPFVEDNGYKPSEAIRALWRRGVWDILSHSITAKAEDWDKHGFYWTTIISGKKQILESFGRGTYGHIFYTWPTFYPDSTFKMPLEANKSGLFLHHGSCIGLIGFIGKQIVPPRREEGTPPRSGRPSTEQDYQPPVIPGIDSQIVSPPEQEHSTGEAVGSPSSKALPTNQPPTIRSIHSRDSSPSDQQPSSQMPSSPSSLSFSSSSHGGSSLSLRTMTDRNNPEYWEVSQV